MYYGFTLNQISKDLKFSKKMKNHELIRERVKGTQNYKIILIVTTIHRGRLEFDCY